MIRTQSPAGSPELAAGSPLFPTTSLRELATREGATAAWRQALAGGIGPTLEAVAGPFAFCVALDDGRIVFGIDRFAIETLCYRVDGDRIRVARRADDLDDGGGLDSQALYDYLYFHAIPSPRTVFRGVLRLAPGHYGVFAQGRLSIHRYWVPQFESGSERPSFDVLKREFRQHLRDAVGRALGTGKAGCYLSGGTDSSTVAGMIGEVAGSPAATFSIGFDATGYDEMAYARIAARHFGTEHHEYYVTPDDLVRGIPGVAASFDQPFGNSSALPAYYCAQMARDSGMTRILAGDGGDELFGGNKRYAKQQVFGWYDSVPPTLRALLEPALIGSPAGRLPGLSKAANYVRQARVPMPDRTQTYNLLERQGVREVLEPAFLADVDPGAPLAQQREVWAGNPARTLVDRQLAFDWRYTLAETDLPKVCGTARLAGLEVGFPMLDSALTDFSLRLPASYKVRRLHLRWFFKEALRGFLPDEIISKKKQGFGLPFGVWMTHHDGLDRMARDALRSLATRGIVRPAFVQTLLNERLGEHPGYYGELVWVLLMLEQWLRQRAPNYRHGR